jgi:hypothetical protein
MTEKLILPPPGEAVRLRAGAVDCLAEVVAVSDSTLTLHPDERVDHSGDAEVLFSSPRGVVALTGQLDGSLARPVLVVTDQRWLEQRRQTFRLAVGCPMRVTRSDGTAIDGTLTDLSLGGALLGTHAAALELDEPVRLEVRTGDFGEATVSAIVVRRDGERRAVRFVSVPADAAAVLERYLAAEQRARLFQFRRS